MSLAVQERERELERDLAVLAVLPGLSIRYKMYLILGTRIRGIYKTTVPADSTAESQHKVQNVPYVKLGKVHVPSNLREAQRSPQWEFWQQAMREEMDSLDTHEVLEYVDRPHGQKVIPVHWIFSTKDDAHGNVTRFKARLVAQGCRQIPGVTEGSCQVLNCVGFRV